MNIEQYRQSFREVVSWRKVGREAELPVVYEKDLTGGDASRLWRYFKEPWTKKFDDGNHDFCVGVYNHETRYEITTDAGPGIVEIISPACDDLHELKRGYEATARELARAAMREDMRLLGYGVQPVTPGSRDLWVPKVRYDALIAALGDKFVHDATIVASDQCHVDIALEEVPRAVNVMNAMSGAIIALTANSTISGGKPNGLYAWRELFWDRFDGFQSQVGIPDLFFRDLEEWFDYLLNQKFVAKKVSEGVWEPRGETYKEYLANNMPSDSDFYCHEGFCWWDARPRILPKSTIEVRPACQQPPHEHMSAQALILGLVNNLPEAEKIMQEYGWGNLRVYRLAAAVAGLHGQVPEGNTETFLWSVLECATVGLKARGRKEEQFLAPLLKRCAKRELPGDIALRLWHRENPDRFLNYFSY